MKLCILCKNTDRDAGMVYGSGAYVCIECVKKAVACFARKKDTDGLAYVEKR